MIRAVIVMNDQGKPRLVKFYGFQAIEKQHELVQSIYGVLCGRAADVSNFIKVDSLFGSDVRLVYKTFATLYFIFVFDSSENELAMLDLMQVFVETLDKSFRNVCELDIVFSFNKVSLILPLISKPKKLIQLSMEVHTILDEIILGGQVLETNSSEIVKAVEEISKKSKVSNSAMLIPSIPGWKSR